MTTCRDEILAVMPKLLAASPDGTVGPNEVVDALMRLGTKYSAATIRTHVVSRMCGNAPDHHARTWNDLERVGRARYRLYGRKAGASRPPTNDCFCGCGEPTSAQRQFRPGHDARLVSQVVNAARTDRSLEDELLTSLPSEALRAKATRLLHVGGTPAAAVIPALSGQVAVEEGVPEPHASDSSVQRDAEEVMLAALSLDVGVPLLPRRLALPDGSHVEVDGVSFAPPVLAEIWAHQGPPKAAQTKKVLADAFKLVHVSAALGTSPRLVLCLSDIEAARPFQGGTWYAGALRRFNIEVNVVELPAEWRDRIRAAQRRQYR